ncbi:flavin reductase [Pseudocolwellia sp. AS88]|uniref:flavin reductase family protein n=1 Tax=Pseudocolwellia sp. AS88 TaxID=3063958 RepID=UPI0026EEF653|nr:flavin reductase [Pseudocolwellia sp. AS88]MDO7086629.1 flavin reductase [Pseudocolwellia sp. AS88]
MEQRYRAKFINSLSGFKSANLIATKNTDGQTNVAIFSSVVHLGASPALVGFIMRPDNTDRHTLNNIVSTKHYTINQVSAEFYRQAHQTSARYSQEESEFSHSGLSTHYIDGINAPFVRESRLKYALTLQDIVHIDLNNTQLIIGEITHILCENKAIQEDGYIDIESLETTCISGLDSYHNTTRLSRLSYAKPDQLLNNLDLSGLPLNQNKEEKLS